MFVTRSVGQAFHHQWRILLPAWRSVVMWYQFLIPLLSITKRLTGPNDCRRGRILDFSRSPDPELVGVVTQEIWAPHVQLLFLVFVSGPTNWRCGVVRRLPHEKNPAFQWYDKQKQTFSDARTSFNVLKPDAEMRNRSDPISCHHKKHHVLWWRFPGDIPWLKWYVLVKTSSTSDIFWHWGLGAQNRIILRTSKL